MPPKINGRNTNDISLKSVGTPTYRNLEKFLDAYGSAGIFEGGTITDSGSGQIDIAAAKGVIRTTNSEIGSLVAFDVAAVTNVDLTDNSMNYIYISYNAGSPAYALTTTYESLDFNDQVIVGRVYRIGTQLYISNVGQDIQNTTLRDLYRLQYIRRMEWGSGAALSFVAATRQPTVTAGVYFANYDKITTAAFDASGAGRFTAWYRNGSGGWTSVPLQQNIDNANYDDGDGTLGSLGVGDYGVHWVYQLVDGTIHIQYGQATYTSLANARNSTVPSSQPTPVVGLGILIGRLIISKNATTIYESSSAFSTVFTGTATTSHNDLANIQGGVAGEFYHVEAPDIPATGRYRNVYGIDNGDTNVTNKAMFDDSATPVMDGVAATGTQMVVARRDHVHPTDTTLIAKTTNITALNETGIADGEIAVFNLTNKDIRSANVTIATTIGSDDTTVPTSKAVNDAVVLKSLVDAKGDLLAATAADTIARLPIGATDGHVLTIDSAETTGMKWAAAGGSSSAPYAIRRYIEGELYTTTLMYHRVNAAATITEARATVGVIPTGANVLVDVRKLDSGHTTNISTASIFSSDTPITLSTGGSLTYGVYSVTGTLDTAGNRDDCAAGDVLLVVVTQVGSTVPGADLEVIISMTPV